MATCVYREIAAGGSCWIETRLSSHKVLPQVGDEVRMINNRLVSSQDMAAGLLLGHEGSQAHSQKYPVYCLRANGARARALSLLLSLSLDITL